MVAKREIEKTQIYQELDQNDIEFWFDFKKNKFLHNIDTFYYSVKLNEDFMEQYKRESAACTTGYEKFVVCMHIYFRIYDDQPEWYDYTREMFSAYSEKNTGSDVNYVFWKYYDKEIPVPAL